MARDHTYHVYILTNRRRTVLYTGVSGDLIRRLSEHRAKTYSAFTARYNVDRLVYFETFGSAYDAIVREKQIKAGSRQDKLDLIDSINPTWRDLSEVV
jgi:putative endonuclease